MNSVSTNYSITITNYDLLYSIENKLRLRGSTIPKVIEKEYFTYIENGIENKLRLHKDSSIIAKMDYITIMIYLYMYHIYHFVY